jgi:methionine sulfoxide reductase catalytic subunit
MAPDRPDREITPESVYLNRRTFIRAGVLLGTIGATGILYRQFNPARRGGRHSGADGEGPRELAKVTNFAPSTQPAAAATTQGFRVDEPQTAYDDITNYNNFYEFSLDKEGVAPAAAKFVARPWTIEVGGLCAKPKTFDLDEILSVAPAEERVYRMRCVEAWSMVIPWAGFSLSKLLEKVEPLSSAKYVAFTTLYDPKRMPNQRGRDLPWPYVEGLRIDEAMHPLAMLASGLYGRELPAQDGAPLRLVVPWKYGFKGIKSIVKIQFVDKQPPTTWSAQAPSEYGFYANVNPNVDHPRWSQASERRIGPDGGRRPTLMFNGYAEQVGHLYAGMDLRANY